MPYRRVYVNKRDAEDKGSGEKMLVRWVGLNLTVKEQNFVTVDFDSEKDVAVLIDSIGVAVIAWEFGDHTFVGEG